MRDSINKVKAEKLRNRNRVTPRRRLDYLGLRLLVAALRMLPIGIGAGLMGRAWRLAGPWTARHKRALGNLEIALPELPQSERTRIAAAQWDNLGRTFAESFQMDRVVAGRDRIEVAVDPLILAKFERPGGLVIASMHSANWEIGALPIRRYRVIAGLYQRLTNPLSDAYVRRLRQHVFDGGLFTKGMRTPGLIMQWVRAGNAMGMLAEHRESRGIAVTFFGQPTRANPFPAMVARRLGVPLFAGRAMRLPGSRFRVEAAEIEVPETDDPESDVRAATQALLDCFEAWIRERPGEWMWVQDRWRRPRIRGTQAAGTRDSSLASNGAKDQI